MNLVILPAFLLRRGELRRRAAGTHRHASCRRRGAPACRQGDVHQGSCASAFETFTSIIHHQTENFSGRHADGPRVQIRGPAGDLRLSRGGARRGMVGRGVDGRLLCAGSRPATTLSTGSRRIRSCRRRSWRATRSITPVRARPRCLWRSCRKASIKSRISEDEWYSRSAPRGERGTWENRTGPHSRALAPSARRRAGKCPGRAQLTCRKTPA